MTNDEINVILDNEDSITAHTTTNMVYDNKRYFLC